MNSIPHLYDINNPYCPIANIRCPIAHSTHPLSVPYQLTLEPQKGR